MEQKVTVTKPKVTTTEPVAPTDITSAVVVATDAYNAAKGHKWWYLSSLVCLLLMFVLKFTGLLKKMGRAKYFVLPILSIGAAVLAAFQGGVGITAAIGVFSSTWAMGMLEEIWNHGILGKPHESA